MRASNWKGSMDEAIKETLSGHTRGSLLLLQRAVGVKSEVIICSVMKTMIHMTGE